jgi:hypothetical protein
MCFSFQHTIGNFLVADTIFALTVALLIGLIFVRNQEDVTYTAQIVFVKFQCIFLQKSYLHL